MPSHQPDTHLDPAQKRRSPGERLAAFSDRVARSVTGTVPEDGLPALSEPLAGDEQETAWFDPVPRFPLVRSGYDCAAVEEHIAALEEECDELERELEALRHRPAAEDQVQAEIKRIGEQTSAILLAAHDRARETAREAQEQADRCLADAAAQALALTQQAQAERAEMERETHQLAEDRTRLLSDMERLAGTLSTVAREAGGRFAGQAGS